MHILKSGFKYEAMYRLVFLLILCTLTYHLMAQDPYETYVVQRTDEPIVPDANWSKAAWKEVEPLTLNNFMGDKPDHFPGVQAKVVYDDDNIYLIWKVEDQYIKAVAQQHQGPVFQDSCVEFFFIPDGLGGTEYFNLEMNCGGTMLFHHQEFNQPERVNITNQDIGTMKVAHTMPRLVPEEIKEKTTWYLEYSIPFAMLNKYYEFQTPASGATWRANFYKCADKTSHPHWLTWSPVDYPEPRFHLPQFFGKLVFE